MAKFQIILAVDVDADEASEVEMIARDLLGGTMVNGYLRGKGIKLNQITAQKPPPTAPPTPRPRPKVT